MRRCFVFRLLLSSRKVVTFTNNVGTHGTNWADDNQSSTLCRGAYLGSFIGQAQTKLSIAQQDMVMEVPYLSILVNGPTCPCGDVKLVAFPS